MTPSEIIKKFEDDAVEAAKKDVGDLIRKMTVRKLIVRTWNDDLIASGYSGGNEPEYVSAEFYQSNPLPVHINVGVDAVTEPKCDCGALHTSNPGYHSDWCSIK